MKQELRNSQLTAEVAKNNDNTDSVNNIDILRRLSQLEKVVYEMKSKEKENN